MIPLFKVFMTKEADKAVADVLQSGYVGEGEKVEEFERAVRQVTGNGNVLMVNSGTSAIMLALRLAGVGAGDYVISTPVTCLATNQAILALGAKPIWADVNPKTGNMSPAGLLYALLPCWPKVKAILCVHWGGYPCDLKEINDIGCRYKIPIIEDAAHAFGATYNQEPIGSHSDYVCFSFQAIKYVTTVDGGAVCCKNPIARERGRLMRWFGLDRSKSAEGRCQQDPKEFGYKWQSNDVAAAIGIENVKSLEWLLDRSRFNASMYFASLHDVSGIELLEYRMDRQSTYWLFTLLVDDRDRFIKHMSDNGVACSEVHARNDKKTIFKDSAVELPGVDEFCSHQVNIPVGWWLSEEDLEHIVDVVRRF
jgi:dTDP-4-amino-4,6-dideoxygalactose transaminase